MDYKEFKEEADKRGIKDLTEQEFDLHVGKFPKLSVSSKIRRVKNARRGKLGGGDRKVVIGDALGQRDFIYGDVTIEKAKNVFVTILDDQGELREHGQRGKWSGQNNRRHEIEVDQGTRVSKAGNEYEYSDIKVTRVLNDSLKLERVKFRDIDDIDEDDLYTPVAIRGEVAGVYGVDIWEDKEVVGEFDYNQGKFPTVTVHIRNDDISVKVAFGPWKNAEPLIKVEDFDLASCESIDDFHGAFAGMNVGIVGSLRSYNEVVDNDGDETTYIAMSGTAIWELDEDHEQEESVAESPKKKKSIKSIKKQDTGGPAFTKDSGELVDLVRAGYEQIGPGITIAALIQGKHIHKDQDKLVVEMAIQMVRGSDPKPVEEEEVEEEEEEVEGEEAGEEQNFMEALRDKVTEIVHEREQIERKDLKARLNRKKVIGVQVKQKDINEAIDDLIGSGLLSEDDDFLSINV